MKEYIDKLKWDDDFQYYSRRIREDVAVCHNPVGVGWEVYDIWYLNGRAGDFEDE